MSFTPQHRWKILSAGVAANASFSCVVGGIPATAVYLRHGYHLSSGQLGTALGIMGLGIAISEIPWGLLTDRWGDRPVLLTGLLTSAIALLCLAVLAGYSPTVSGLYLGLLAAGLLGSSVNGASGRAIMLWFAEGQRGLAMSIRQTAVPGGYAIGVLLMPWLAGRYGFIGVFNALAGLCLVCWMMAWRWIHEPAVKPYTPSVRRQSPLGDPRILRMVTAISLLCGPQFAVLTYATLFLHDRLKIEDMTISCALAVVQVGAIVGRLWSGRWTDRLNNRRPFLKACALLCTLGFAALSANALWLGSRSVTYPFTAVALIVGAGILASIWHGVAYAELASLAGAQRSGTALAMGNAGVFLVLFLVPVVSSTLLAHWGWAAVWGAAALCAMLATVLFPVGHGVTPGRPHNSEKACSGGATRRALSLYRRLLRGETGRGRSTKHHQ